MNRTVEMVATQGMTDLANALSDAIAAALRAGMDPAEAIGIAAAVTADYGRGCYGDEYLFDIVRIVMDRVRFPMPSDLVLQ